MQDLIYDFEIIDPNTTFIPSATGRNASENINGSSTSRNYETPNPRMNLSNPSSNSNPTTASGIQRRSESTKFPEYIWVMQVLAQIQSIQHLRTPMQKFLREKIFNNRHMTVDRLRADGVLNLLREFDKQETITSQTFQKEVNFSEQSYQTLSPRDRAIAEQAVDKVIKTLQRKTTTQKQTMPTLPLKCNTTAHTMEETDRIPRKSARNNLLSMPTETDDYSPEATTLLAADPQPENQADTILTTIDPQREITLPRADFMNPLIPAIITRLFATDHDPENEARTLRISPETQRVLTVSDRTLAKSDKTLRIAIEPNHNTLPSPV
jgi:hypothetical protein